MPRRKPDGKGVIVHRIELGNKERELAEASVNAFKSAQYASAGSKVADSITGGFKSMVSPLTQASIAGAITAGTLSAILGAYILEEITEGSFDDSPTIAGMNVTNSKGDGVIMTLIKTIPTVFANATIEETEKIAVGIGNGFLGLGDKLTAALKGHNVA
jgi:hypothetical protein